MSVFLLSPPVWQGTEGRSGAEARGTYRAVGEGDSWSSVGLGLGDWGRTRILVSVPGCWDDLESDHPPFLVRSPSGVTPSSPARPPLLPCPGKKA